MILGTMRIVSFYFLLFFTSTTQDEGTQSLPDFLGVIANATVAMGREAVLSCSVKNLGPFKVGWLRAEDQTVLSLDTKVVTHSSRVSVTHDGQSTWRLHIRQIRQSDQGCYMCQINTGTMKNQIGCIDVHVPPDIVDGGSSSDVSVQEGGNATLVCSARGHPPPRITWRREDQASILLRPAPRHLIRVNSFRGKSLFLMRLDRTQMGAYLCIASNDVPPAVSKRIILNVNFAPVIKVANQLLGSPLGSDVTMSCHIEAFPHTINYWLKHRRQVLLSGKKHGVEERRRGYKVELRLTVRHMAPSDTGTYLCLATNSLGRAEGTVRLYEIKIPLSTSTVAARELATTIPPGTDSTFIGTYSTTDDEVKLEECDYEEEGKSSTKNLEGDGMKPRLGLGTLTLSLATSLSINRR